MEDLKKIGWTKVFSLVMRYRWTVFTSNMAAIMAALSVVLLPLQIPLIIDELFLNQEGELVSFLNTITPDNYETNIVYIWEVVFFCLLLRIIYTGFHNYQYKGFLKISKNVTCIIRNNLISATTNISYEKYKESDTGEIINCITRDVSEIENFIGMAVSKLIVGVLMIVSCVAALMVVNVKIATIIIVIYPIVLILTFKMGNKIYEMKTRESEAYESLTQQVITFFDGIMQLKLLGGIPSYEHRLSIAFSDVRNKSIKYEYESNKALNLSALCYGTGIDLLYGFCLIMTLVAEISIGQVLAIIAYLYFMTNPLYNIFSFQLSYSAAKSSLYRINKILLLRENERQKKSVFRNKKQDFSLLLENVVYSYEASRPLLNRINISIKGREKIALVGLNGCGKTTISNLISGLLSPKSGKILVDGVDVSDSGVGTIISSVPQAPYFFPGSVKDNLNIVVKNEDSRLWDALRKVELDIFFKALPEGLNTNIGKYGAKLSGGQLQRLSLARAILGDCKMIVLDEPTSALDVKTEDKVLLNIRESFEDKALLIISHRLNSIKWVDRILVLHNGDIVEDGSHDELMINQGLYHTLYNTNSKKPQKISA